MTMLRNITKSRIVAIPLTRPSPYIAKSSQTAGSRYTFYQFQIASQKPQPPSDSGSAAKGTPPQTGISGIIAQIKEKGLSTWVQQKSADTWDGFGKAKGGWKLKLHQAGEKIIDRLEFEELALKSLDPSMGPSITHLKSSPVYEQKNKPATIPVLFPPSVLSPLEMLGDLRAYAEHRIPRHKKGFIIWLIIAPFTAPFMIVPIVPNIPFFFCVWRAWSHYAAYKSSLYLKALIDHDILVPEPSQLLDDVYQRKRLSAPETSPATSESVDSSTATPSSSQSEAQVQSEASETSAQAPQDVMLLTRADVPIIISTLKLRADGPASVDLNRAVEQARIRVSKGHPAI